MQRIVPQKCEGSHLNTQEPYTGSGASVYTSLMADSMPSAARFEASI
jgi:hypothetical protein